MRIYSNNPELRGAKITKTGPWEVTIKVPLDGLMTGLSRFSDSNVMYPPDVITKYGNMNDWRNLVGTGPFMLIDYVAGSTLVLQRNPNYWQTDPIGPGKGNKLPYLDGISVTIITDTSTRLAAFRTGKIDQINALSWEDTAQFKKEFPNMPSAAIGDWYSPGGSCIYMRTDKAPAFRTGQAHC